MLELVFADLIAEYLAFLLHYIRSIDNKELRAKRDIKKWVFIYVNLLLY